MSEENNLYEKSEEKRLKEKGNKALIANIIFFVVLFLVILLTPRLGVVPASVLILLAFIASLLYIYRF